MCKPCELMRKGAAFGAGEARAPEEYPVPDPKDATTPDKWVKRHPALVRLRVEIKRRGASPPSAAS